jgi:Ca2+-binding EF-hand superfamily protein
MSVANGADNSLVLMKQLFDGYLAMTKKYTPPQQKVLLLRTVDALQTLMKDFSAEVQKQPEKKAEDHDSSHRKVLDVEYAIHDKYESLGKGPMMFARFDQSKSGRLSSAQFTSALASIGINITPEEVAMFMKKFDSDGGGLPYEKFMKYINAKVARNPRTASSSNHTRDHFQREAVSVDDLHAHAKAQRNSVPEELRLAQGLTKMREMVYLRSESLVKLFQKLLVVDETINVEFKQSHRRPEQKVPIAGIVPKLHAMGFPNDSVPDDVLENAVMEYGQQEKGFLTYAEFIDFFMGRSPTPAETPEQQSSKERALQRAIVSLMVKLNNLDLRKEFRDWDGDHDGYVTREELCRGLEEHGLSPAISRGEEFIDALKPFCKMQKGKDLYAYADFLRFCNLSRNQQGQIAGQPIFKVDKVKLADDMNPGEMLRLLWLNTKAISTKAVFRAFDVDKDGFVSPSEFYLALTDMGFVVSATASQKLFDAFDHDGNGKLDYEEVASAIINPNRHKKLATRVRQAPGGDSDLLLANDESHQQQEVQSTGRKRVQSPGGKSDFQLSYDDQALEDGEAEDKAKKPHKTFHPERNKSTVKLGGGPNDDFSDVKKPPLRDHKNSRSQIDFEHDHGAPEKEPQKAPAKISSVKFSHDPLDEDHEPEPPSSHRLIKKPPGGGSVMRFNEEGMFDPSAADSLTQPQHTGKRHPPGGVSQVKLDQNHVEPHRPLIKSIAPPGGTGSISLRHDPTDEDIPNEAVTPVHLQRKHIEDELKKLAYDDDDPPPKSPRRGVKLVKDVNGSNNSGSLRLTHPSRNMETPPPPVRKQKGAAESNKQKTTSTTWEGPAHVDMDEEIQELLEQEEQQEHEHVNPALLVRVSDAVFSRARVKHTFQVFTKARKKATLPKADFARGMKSYEVDLTDEEVNQLYTAFDRDRDGELSYSEFVRMLSRSNNHA